MDPGASDPQNVLYQMLNFTVKSIFLCCLYFASWDAGKVNWNATHNTTRNTTAVCLKQNAVSVKTKRSQGELTLSLNVKVREKERDRSCSFQCICDLKANYVQHLSLQADSTLTSHGWMESISDDRRLFSWTKNQKNRPESEHTQICAVNVQVFTEFGLRLSLCKILSRTTEEGWNNERNRNLGSFCVSCVVGRPHEHLSTKFKKHYVT